MTVTTATHSDIGAIKSRLRTDSRSFRHPVVRIKGQFPPQCGLPPAEANWPNQMCRRPSVRGTGGVPASVFKTSPTLLSIPM